MKRVRAVGEAAADDSAGFAVNVDHVLGVVLDALRSPPLDDVPPVAFVYLDLRRIGKRHTHFEEEVMRRDSVCMVF